MAENYYKNQLNKINFKGDFKPKFKVTDSHGNETNWMDLNSESITAILEWLNDEIKSAVNDLEKSETKQGSYRKIDFTRIDNDVNGNPRYVVHYLDLKRPDEKLSYEQVIKRANKIGGKKYHTKKFGGGIVFQSYNISDVEKEIKELLENIGKYKVAFVQILHDGSTKKGLTEITYNTKEAAEVYAKQLKRNNTGIKSAKVVEA